VHDFHGDEKCSDGTTVDMEEMGRRAEKGREESSPTAFCAFFGRLEFGIWNDMLVS
jgi:hypothetical protein